jgi:hypothetical protein
MKIKSFDIKIRWSVHLISMKGLVVYILKKCENKIIYIKYGNHTYFSRIKVKFREYIVRRKCSF